MFKLKNQKKILILAGIGIVVSLALTVAINGKFPPGTTIAGIDISYKTPEQAREILTLAKQNYIQTPIQITHGDSLLETTPEELGIDILVDRTIQTIKETNAANLSVANMFAFSQTKPNPIDILTEIDYEKIISKVNIAFSLEELAPQPAAFYFNKNKLDIKEQQPGLVLDQEKLIRDLRSSAKQLSPQPIVLSMQETTPEITKEVLEAQQDEIKERLRYKFSLIDPIYSEDWHMSLADHLDWVIFSHTQNTTFLPFPQTTTGETTTIEINQQKLNEFIDAEISKWLDRPVENVNIYINEEGEVIVEGKGQNGLEVQRGLLKHSIELAVEHKITEVPIPVLEIAPEIIISEDLQELGITERLGIGHTSYYGSPANRVHNIKTGAAKVNGSLIAPDEVFSFNQTLGRVDASTGYREELVIKPEGTIPEYGGGLCQLSTTVYRAILFSGLPVVERNQHSYAVTYYSQILGHGLDATIYLGGADLKFQNNTGRHVLVQAYTENDYELYIVFYGTPDNRTVEMEGPYLSNYKQPGDTIYEETTELPPGEEDQVEKRHTGFDALWYRHITTADGTVTTEPIETKYRAIPAKILIGIEPPTSSDQSPEPSP